MKICKEFIIKNLFDYMILNEIDILEEIGYCNLSVMTDVVKIGNNCSDEEAEDILYTAIEEYGIEAVAEELAYEVIGHRPEENEKKQSSNEFHSFSDVLESFYNDVQSIDSNLSISEFMSMSTRYVYRYANGLQKRCLNNENKELRNDYRLVCMFFAALSGKLKECPQLNEDGSLKEEDEIEKIKKFFAERSNK